MDVFRTVTRLWPTGDDLGGGIDSQTLSLAPPASVSEDRTAAQFVVSDDGTHTYQFLFWNTGRHITNRRKVIWNFSRFGWGVWTATRWYGIPPTNGGGQPRVRADAFDLHGNALLSPDSPIDAAASTFAPPGAHPFNGDDHAIGTATAGATVVAHAHMSAYDFAGWIQLLWGGDPTGDFVETDVGTSGSFGSGSFYDTVPAGTNPFVVAMGQSADLLAAYAPASVSIPSKFGHIDWEKVIFGPWHDIPQIGDPGPEDLLRLAILEGLVQRTRPGPVGAGITDIERVIESASRMTKDELTRAKQSLQTTLDLGKSALHTIEARLKQQLK